MNDFQKALIKAGITYEFLLEKTDELIDAIKKGEFKPRNKEKELAGLYQTRKGILKRMEEGYE